MLSGESTAAVAAGGLFMALEAYPKPTAEYVQKR
jgi:hypothetical protein